MWSSNTLVNPSFIILKITSPRKTPDTTTVFDGGPWYAESRSSMGEQPAPLPISKPKEPMARCTHRGYLRELTSDPITHTLITSHCACFQVLDPRAPLHRGFGFECIDYPIPQLSISKKRYWIATLSCLQHTVHIFILKTLTSCSSLCQKFWGNIHHRKTS